MMQCPSCSAPLVRGESRCVSCHALVNPQAQGTSALAPRLVTPPGAGAFGSPFDAPESRTDDPPVGAPVAESRISEPRVSEDDAWRQEVLERVRKRRQARTHALPLFGDSKPGADGPEPTPEVAGISARPAARQTVEDVREELENPFEDEPVLSPGPVPDLLASLEAPLSNPSSLGLGPVGDLALRPAEREALSLLSRARPAELPSQSLVERVRPAPLPGPPSPRSLVADLPLVEPSRVDPRLVEAPPRTATHAVSSRAASLNDRMQAAFIDLGTWSAMTVTAFYFASRIARTSILGLGPAWQGLVLFAAVLGAAYILFFGGLSGATPGKLACGIQVRRYDGSSLGPLGSLARGLLGILGVVFFGIGIWPALWDKDRRALHDRVTDSRVTLAGF